MHASHLAKLNPEQRRAAEYGGPSYAEAGPLLIIAGAGSGKTNTLAHRVLVTLCKRYGTSSLRPPLPSHGLTSSKRFVFCEPEPLDGPLKLSASATGMNRTLSAS